MATTAWLAIVHMPCHRPKFQLPRAIGITSAALLVGCGGGGSGAPAAPVTSFPLNSVVTGLASRGGTFSGGLTDAQGNVYKLTVSYAPDGAGWFVRTETLTTNGVNGEPKAIRVRFNQTGTVLQVTGWMDTTHGTANVQDSRPLPDMAMIGSRGDWFSGHVSSATQETLSFSYGWAMQAVSESNAELCVSLGYLSGLTVFGDTDCFRIDPSGTIVAFKSIHDFHKSTFSSQKVYQ